MEEFNKNEQEKIIDLEPTPMNVSNEKAANLPLSILFSIIGAFIGIIPAIICVAVLDLLVAVLFALTPIAAFYGYKLGKAPINNLTTVIVVLESLFVTGLAVFGGFYIIAAAAGVNLLEIINEPELGFWVSFLQAELFAALGIWVAWKIIRKK